MSKGADRQPLINAEDLRPTTPWIWLRLCLMHPLHIPTIIKMWRRPKFDADKFMTEIGYRYTAAEHHNNDRKEENI